MLTSWSILLEFSMRVCLVIKLSEFSSFHSVSRFSIVVITLLILIPKTSMVLRKIKLL